MLLKSLLFAAAAWAADPDPAALLREVAAQPRPAAMQAKLTLTIHDRGGRMRVRVLQTEGLHHEGAWLQRMVFTEPQEVAGTTVWSTDYDDPSKEDTQHLFLPSFGRVTAVGKGERKGSFMGSDLSFGDLTLMDPNAWTPTLIGPHTLDGRALWKIDARPATPAVEADTGYARTELWVDPERDVVVYAKAWVVDGRKIKETRFEDWAQVGGSWVPRSITVKTLQEGDTKSTTTLQLSELVSTGLSLDPARFEPVPPAR